jgi:tetratricopeptide (TPR) repeat protein
MAFWKRLFSWTERWTQATTDTGNIDELLAQADSLLSEGSYAKAEKATKLVLNSEPRSERAWLLLGHIYSAAGKPAKAAMYFEQTLALDPDNDLAARRLETLKDFLAGNPQQMAIYKAEKEFLGAIRRFRFEPKTTKTGGDQT